MTIDRLDLFHRILTDLDRPVGDILAVLTRQAGLLTAAQAAQAMSSGGLDQQSLIGVLAQLAGAYAWTPISGFRVGAVALAGTDDDPAETDYFLGANLEFPGLPLNQTVHAEQAAATNAWLRGRTGIRAVAASETVCGFCRQFICEFPQPPDLMAVPPGGRGGRLLRFTDMLPGAFGPAQFGVAGLSGRQVVDLILNSETDADELVRTALEAARRSYAPYTGNLSGCALRTDQGRGAVGRCFESAAYNPSLGPLQSALSQLYLQSLDPPPPIRRAVLVEQPTKISQRPGVEMLLRAVAPDVTLEYHQAGRPL